MAGTTLDTAPDTAPVRGPGTAQPRDSGRLPVACCAPIAAEGLTEEAARATATVFKAMADPARVRILNLLLGAEGPVCVCDITPVTGLAQPTVSHHLKKLMEAGLLTRQERGTWAYYSVDREALGRLGQVLDIGRGKR